MMKQKIGNSIKNFTERFVLPHVGPMGVRIERDHIMNYVFEFVAKSDIDGSFLEFGCYRGSSFIKAYRAYLEWLEVSRKAGWALTKQTMYAFDSFQGLPELKSGDILKDYSVFKKGQYSCPEAIFLEELAREGVDLSMIKTIPGFYQDTLKPKLRKELEMDKAVVIHIDCDLYSSAISVLNFVFPLLQDGTLMLFDDFYCYKANPNYGVQKAFNEWIEKQNLLVTDYISYSWAGKAFIVNKNE